MEVMIYLTALVLGYKLLMPFVAWIVPSSKIDAAAKYIERTERRFPTKSITNWFREWGKNKNTKKKP